LGSESCIELFCVSFEISNTIQAIARSMNTEQHVRR